MHIILTHEQADFDALASSLAAHLIYDGTIPVLPRRMNRNVRAFLTLYGLELPFVDPRDLPPGDPIDVVTLVDTQSMISIKGMTDATRVHVIDHHPLREDLPVNWDITVAGTGANTTLFIETLRERDILLGTIQATLLLLGIYEDTGSLTYTRTTARDLKAASYLLEQGASLRIASDFLNHPLSSSQQTLYDQLRSNAEYHRIFGHTVIITCGDGQGVDEELSTVAHKLRDLLDPEALLVLVTTRGGIQLIARSTSDNIDVAEIAAHFGGGGHERAAAGLIKDKTLEEVRKELIKILPVFVKPAITVSQIMSRGPQLLSPDTPVDEAAQRMQRYGYEGYPVVRDGKLVGLLTRRAVDRATAHKLNLTAASLMDAGEYIVHPADSIEYLQRLMTDSGWGQIPVVHPESGKIIGIVTRTDLLKTLTPRPRIPSRQNLAERLETALPAAHLALLKAVANAAHNRRDALYIVGGFVRDLMLDRPSLDFDLVVEGDAIALARNLAHSFGGRVTSHARFGTAKWIIADIREELANQLLDTYPVEVARAGGSGDASDLPKTLDLITARTEFYAHPTALPTVERGSIKLDLHRRDFTINTLALRLDGHHYGELHDYWGGLNDLHHGMVRVLHSLSFVDDPTRILRAVRFEQRFGFKIEARTLELLEEATSLLDRVSGDRIRHELNYILKEERAPRMLARLSELKLLKAIHPDLTWDDWLFMRIKELLSKEPGKEWGMWSQDSSSKSEVQEINRDLIYILWLIRLPPGHARNIISRLKLPAALARTIYSARDLWRDLPTLENAKPSAISTRLNGISPWALYAVYLAAEKPDLRGTLQMYVSRWQRITPTITGNNLRARGLAPGPHYRYILKRLRDAWLDGEVSSKEEEDACLERLVKESTNVKPKK
jgi:tRNA nucleotidyltransferase (CCA-adding enzyme)